MLTRKAVSQVVGAVLETGAIKATKYLSPKLTVKATRRVFKRMRGKQATTDIVLTIGKPNYDEREFIKKAKKAGEPFPIKRVLLKFKAAKKG